MPVEPSASADQRTDHPVVRLDAEALEAVRDQLGAHALELEGRLEALGRAHHHLTAGAGELGDVIGAGADALLSASRQMLGRAAFASHEISRTAVGYAERLADLDQDQAASQP